MEVIEYNCSEMCWTNDTSFNHKCWC